MECGWPGVERRQSDDENDICCGQVISPHRPPKALGGQLRRLLLNTSSKGIADMCENSPSLRNLPMFADLGMERLCQKKLT